MSSSALLRRRLGVWWLRVLRASAAAIVASCAAVADLGKRQFDLPAGEVEQSLKRFSIQSTIQVVFASDLTDGLRANAVKGEFTPMEALDRLLAGTALRATYDGKTGVVSIVRLPNTEKTPAQKKSPAGRAGDTGRPTRSPSAESTPPTRPLPDKPPHPMNRKNPLTFLLTWLGLAATPAQPTTGAEATTTIAVQPAATGTIAGRISNEATGQYLRGAVVTVVGTSLATVSESGGVYTLGGVPAGEARLTVSFLGLDPVHGTVNVGAGQTAVHDVTMAGGTNGIVKLDAFRVVTERESNYKAIQQQKSALEIKNVVSADAFGDVSEGNVGEFLKFMPGVMLDYVDADVRSVSISGMNPKYALIMMDGAPVASGSVEIGVGRGLEFEQLSISGIENVELSKTPTPDVAGSALAGVINLRSKGAFDRRGRQIRWSGGVEMNSYHMTLNRTPGPTDRGSYKIHPNYSLEFSDVFFGEKLGILAGLSYSTTFVEENIILYGYEFDANRANNATEVAPLTFFRLTDSPKITDRANYNLRLDYKFSPNLSVWTRLNYSAYEGRNFRHDLVFFPGNVINGPRANDPQVAGTEYSLNSQTTTNGELQLAGGFAFNKNGTTTTISSGGTYRHGDFSADVQGQVSRALSTYEDMPFGFFTSIAAPIRNLGLRWNRNGSDDPAFNLTQLGGPDWRNSASYPSSANPGLRYVPATGREDRITVKTDLRYNRSIGGIPVLFKGGGDVGQQTRKTQSGAVFNITYLGADGIADSGDDRWTFEPYRPRNLAGGNLQDVGVPDRFVLAKIYGAIPGQFTRPTDAQILQRSLTTRNKVKEQVDSVYQQTVVKLSNTFTFAPGVRYERTRSAGTGATDLGDRHAKRQLTGDPAANIPTDTVPYVLARYGSTVVNNSNYSTWLKYLHATYRHGENLVFRASFNNSISRPDLGNLSGGIVVDELSVPPNARIPNPSLKPERGRNVFASAEYYFPKGGGFVTLSGARRDISNLIQSNTVDVPPGGNFPNDDGLNLGGYRVTTTANIGRAHLSTLELSYRQNLLFLPGLLNSLSIFGNYTLLRYDNYENFRRPHHLANGGVSFDRRGLSLRWNMTWAPTYRRDAVNPTTGFGGFLGDRLSHDAQFDYRLLKGTSIFIGARNIFNRPQKAYSGSGGRLLMTSYASYGTVWTAGVRGQF